MELKFKRDTSFRKQFFTPKSFAHPAKMDAHLLLWIVGKYIKPGEVILDPMAGMGTTMLACTLGRDVVLVELEEKFCKMCQDNWEIVKTKPHLGHQIGSCQIIQGDARQLEGLLVDKCIFSPPFGEAHNAKGLGVGDGDRADLRDYSYLKTETEGQIGNLPYGQIDKIVTSPPYEGSDVSQTHMTSNKRGDPNDPNYRPSWKRKLAEGYAETKRPYHEVDSIITSPPYEASVSDNKEGPGAGGNEANYGRWAKGTAKKQSYTQHGEPTKEVDSIITSPPYEEAQSGGGIAKKGYQGSKHSPTDLVGKRSYMPENIDDAEGNIGNLKSDSYLEAMLQVYQQCHKVLKPEGGLLILVTKNFIRNKQVIRLDEDTIKLCEQAGFNFLERHYRKLTSQSFWRTIYHQKYPGVEKIEHEDVLVFNK